ncbi:hypothetical protein PS6_002081 [Mucor atramentarius]
MADVKKTFGGIAAKPSSIVLVGLATIRQGREYIAADKSWATPDELKTKEEADTFVDSFCGRLLESIAVSSNGSWMYILQVMAHVTAEDYWRVCVPVVPVQVVAECRLLRNFTKRASGFKWHWKSERFHVNEFSTP